MPADANLLSAKIEADVLLQFRFQSFAVTPTEGENKIHPKSLKTTYSRTHSSISRNRETKENMGE